jgi:hypothetical protein
MELHPLISIIKRVLAVSFVQGQQLRFLEWVTDPAC